MPPRVKVKRAPSPRAGGVTPSSSLESLRIPPHVQPSNTSAGRGSNPIFGNVKPLPSLKPKTDDGKSSLQSDEERLISILQRTLNTDPEEHESRAILLNSTTLFFPKKDVQFSNNVKDLMLRVLISVFSTPPPFSIITRSYRRILFNPKEHPSDITVGYKIFKVLAPQIGDWPLSLLKALMHRLTSASNEDRAGAKACLMTIETHVPLVIHLIALTLTPPPPHGTADLLDLAVNFLSKYKPPPPLFDDFFVTTSFDDEGNVLSINSTISAAHLNDGYTIFEELWCTFRMLHYAPHYQSFFQSLLKAIVALQERNEEFASQCRHFILNHWPRLDPQKAVLFMQEATAICTSGPPVEEAVWQKLANRACSIHWQIAMEGLNFVQQTLPRTKGFDVSVLAFLLEDTAKSHWHNGVRTKAAAVIELLPKDVKPRAPTFLRVDKWNALVDAAQVNYPNETFQRKAPIKRRK